MSNTNTNLQTQTTNALHNAIMEACGKDRPPMLAPGNYFKWTEKTVRVAEGSSKTTIEGYMENYKNVSQDIRDQLNAEAEAVQIILTGIDKDIYSTVDACPYACEMWKAIERLKQGESINVQDLETSLYWEFGKFTSRDVNHLNRITQEWQRSQQAATRNRGKAIVNSSPPTYDQEPTMVAEDDEMSKEKEIDKLMALISLSFKKIYKPTNNNIRTSSNTSRANQDNTPRINKGTGYDNQKVVNVAGARENVGTKVMHQSEIQCYNCKEYEHVARECQKPKHAKDATYHKEKMLLCKQEEVGFQLNAEQPDWRDDTDDVPDDQELEAHYMYIAQIQEVTPDVADNYENIFDAEPEHPKQPESVNDIYLEEQGDSNITIDSLNMSTNGETVDQDDDDLSNEHDLLASLLEKLKCEINDSKNRNKILKSSNKALVDELKYEIEDFKTKNKSLESSNNQFKEANNELSKTNQLMFKDLKKFQAELDRYHDVNYASKVEIDCTKAKGDLVSYKMESQKSFNEYTRKINDLNQTISEMKNELFAHQETISIMSQEKEAQKKFHKTREDKELEKVVALENKIKVLDDIIYKTGQSVQTMNMLNRNCKTSFVKSEFLKKAQRANPRLYDIGCYNDNLALMLAPESDETIRLTQESRSKLSDLIRPFDYEKLNNLYDLFVPQREKSSEQRYFSESSVDTIFDGVERCKQTIAKRTYFGHIDPFIQNTIEGNFCPQIRRINADLEKFHLCLKEEMVADLRYFNSLEHEVDSLKSQLETQKTQFLNEIDRLSREYYYADHMNAILGVYTTLNEFTDLQCDYVDQVVKCERLKKELSKSNTKSKSFEALQQHAINLELALQQCQEHIKNDKAFKENKGIAISELKKLTEKMKGKYVETKFEKPSIIRQPNAFKSQRQSVLGKPATFSDSLAKTDFSKSKSVTTNNVSNDFSKLVTAQILPQNVKSILKNTNVIALGIVTRPQLKSNRLKDRVMHNDSQGMKQQVEDHRRNFKFSNNKTSVTACNDSLNAKTSNVNFVCVTCGKCVLNENHDMCVLHYFNGVNSRTKMPMVVPISTREPKRAMNQSVATPLKRTIAAESTNQKPRSTIRKQYKRISKTCRWWYCNITPPGYKWKPRSRTMNVEPNLVEIILFIVDFGCSKHMTGNLKLLSSFVEKFLGTMKFGNDQIAPILGYGDLVQGNVTIKRVYYVKGLNHNLFSVGQFCDADLKVAFRKSTCYIRDLKGNYLLTGSRGTDLYSITLQDTSTPNLICLMAKATSSQAWLWHRRLSHLNFDTINLLSKYDMATGLPKLKFVKDHLCSSCELGKAKRKSFHTKTTPSSKRRLQLLHMDLCGPMRVESINGKKYVLTRSKRTSCLKGIEHQTFVARTPEQISVVERWNGTLVEAARTMLSAAKVPLYFWAEAITTTCFTQNCSLFMSQSESKENVPQAAETETTPNELDLLFSPMFDELLNRTTQVVSKSSAVTTADAPNKCQQQNTTQSTTTTVATDIPPLIIQTTPQTTNQAPTVTSIENINQAETDKVNAQVKEDEFINIFSTRIQERGETSSRHVD
ncbi:retrovirus-related pol polyprotein from transposon TNT 1-94 [Tanacetum coccineum]